MKFYLIIASVIVLMFQPFAAMAEGEDISLEEMLNTPINTVTKYNQLSGETPAAITLITSDDIQRYGYRSLTEVLEKAPGFFARSDHNYKYLGVRGTDIVSSYGGNILLMLDGHIINENVYDSPFHGMETAIDMDIIERIEIIRSPGSVMYGNSSMISVINVITKKGKNIDGLMLKGSYGSYNDKAVSVTYGAEPFHGFDCILSARFTDSDGEDRYYSEFDELETDNGIAKDMDKSECHFLFAKMSYMGFDLLTSYTNMHKRVPTGYYEVLFNDKRTSSHDKRYTIELQKDIKLSDNYKLQVRGFFDKYYAYADYPYEDSFFDEESNGTWCGADVEAVMDFAPANRTVAGINIKYSSRCSYTSWEDNETLVDLDDPFSVVSFFIQDDYQFAENFSISGGIRYDINSNFTDSYSPRLGLTWKYSDKSNLKFLLCRSYRIPNFYERVYEDPEEALPNPNLRYETMHIAELINQTKIGDNIVLNSSLYLMRLENLLRQVITDDDLYQFQNLNSAIGLGLEIGSRVKFSSELNGYVNYTLQGIQNYDNHHELANSPNNLLRTGLSYSPVDNLIFSAEALYESDRKTIWNSKTKPFWLMNIFVQYQIELPGFISPLGLRLKAINLFDQKYSLPAGNEFIQQSLMQDSRRLYFELFMKIR